MHVIGLTGGIGVGKSEVAKALADHGSAIIDADAEGHHAYDKGSIGWRRVVEIFSSGILNEDGEVDRSRLGALVFANPQALAWLNAAIHPLIRQRVTQAIAQHRENGVDVAVVDAALLYQARWDDLADEIWVVSAPPGAVAERLRERGMTADDIRRRTEAQAGAEAAFARADVIIDNYGSLDGLKARVQELWQERILSRGNAVHD